MILAVDVAYRNEKAAVGGVLFRNWTDEKPLQEHVIFRLTFPVLSKTTPWRLLCASLRPF